jgi:4-hydroxy-tetrahydrodipicolinate synthase
MKSRRPFTGTITALVTPFKSGAVAYDDLRQLVNFQIKNGIDGPGGDDRRVADRRP